MGWQRVTAAPAGRGQRLALTDAWPASQTNIDVLYVDYRNAVAEPAATAVRLNDFLDAE